MNADDNMTAAKIHHSDSGSGAPPHTGEDGKLKKSRASFDDAPETPHGNMTSTPTVAKASVKGTSAGADLPMATSSRADKAKKLVIGALLIGIIVYVIADFPRVESALVSFQEWVQNNVAAGAAAYAAVYAVAAMLFVPGSILTIGAGVVFAAALGTGLGVLIGSITVFIGATAAACCSFLLGRYVLRDAIQSWIDKFAVMRAINTVIQTQGLKLTCLLRLSPAVPFSAFNYIMGLTQVSFRDYALASAGMIPGTIAYVFIGAIGGGAIGSEMDTEMEESKSQSQKNVEIAVFAVGGVATLVAAIIIGRYSKKALNAALEEANEDGEGEVSAMEMGKSGASDGMTEVTVENPVLASNSA